MESKKKEREGGEGQRWRPEEGEERQRESKEITTVRSGDLQSVV